MKKMITLSVAISILDLGYLIMNQFVIEKFNYFLLAVFIGSISTILRMAGRES